MRNISQNHLIKENKIQRPRLSTKINNCKQGLNTETETETANQDCKLRLNTANQDCKPRLNTETDY